MTLRCFRLAFDKDNKNLDFRHKQENHAQSIVLSESILVAKTVKILILTCQDKLQIW